MAMNPKLAEFLRKQAEKKLSVAVAQTQAMPEAEGKKESFAMSIILDEDQDALGGGPSLEIKFRHVLSKHPAMKIGISIQAVHRHAQE